MIECYNAYDANEECNACVHSKSVTSQDFAPYHICFALHDKSTEHDGCSHFEPKNLTVLSMHETLMKYLTDGKAPVRVITVSEYWDCACNDDYIRHKDNDLCIECLANRYESPDARLVEVIDYLINTVSN